MEVQKQSYVYYFFSDILSWYWRDLVERGFIFLFDLTNHDILSHISMPKIFPWIFQQKKKQLYNLITFLMLSNAMATSHICLIKLKLIKTK